MYKFFYRSLSFTELPTLLYYGFSFILPSYTPLPFLALDFSSIFFTDVMSSDPIFVCMRGEKESEEGRTYVPCIPVSFLSLLYVISNSYLHI